jgi:hypothetical protein
MTFLQPRSCKGPGYKRKTFMAAVHGAQRLGFMTDIKKWTETPRSDMVLTWGGSGDRRKIKYSKIWFHLDGGFVQRNSYVRVSLNDFNSDAYMHKINLPQDRWDKLGITLKPWKTQGEGNIFICCSSRPAMARVGMNLDREIEKVMKILKNSTEREIIIRHKNKKKKRDSFIEAIKNAHAVVVWHSAAGIEAAIEGIPVFAKSLSVASPIASADLSKIDHPIYPTRQQCLNNVAYHQWTDEELGSGIPFDFLLSNYL